MYSQDWQPLGHWSKDRGEKGLSKKTSSHQDMNDIKEAEQVCSGSSLAENWQEQESRSRSYYLWLTTKKNKLLSGLKKKKISLWWELSQTKSSVLHTRLCENATPLYYMSGFKHSKQGPTERILKTTLLTQRKIPGPLLAATARQLRAHLQC